eukprot:GHVR01082046.1.p1 GENE.GHVR01082046.1~~GHVR01082046.1.p1  ORF type:complete len:195 (-),score=45.08 GHVR01082046.1:194-778(-)
MSINADVSISTIEPAEAKHSTLIRAYLEFDEKIANLVSLVRIWAVSRGIGSAFSGHFSSFGWTLMVFYFFIIRGYVPSQREMMSSKEGSIDAPFTPIRCCHSAALPSFCSLLFDFFFFFGYELDMYSECVCLFGGANKTFIINKDHKNNEDSKKHTHGVDSSRLPYFTIIDPHTHTHTHTHKHSHILRICQWVH